MTTENPLIYLDEDLTEWDGIDDEEASIWKGEEDYDY